MPVIQIEPLDTLFFRDGKPFNMGDETWAEGMFPPNPSVIYGALRSAWASQNGVTNSQDIEEKTNGLVIKKIYYKFNGNIIYPMPLDLVEPKEKDRTEKNREEREKTYKVNELKVKSREELYFHSNFPLDMSNILIGQENIQIETVNDGMILGTDLETYLCGENNSSFEIFRLSKSKMIKVEPKIGIGRDNFSKTSEDGKLYRVNMNRLDKFQIYMSYSNLDLKDNEGFLKLGGETKTARYKTQNRGLSDIQNTQIEPHMNFKIVLTTPAIFNINNYYPNIQNANLISACIGKSILIGGFDIKEKKPKTMLKAIPAGSVFYYKLQSDKLELPDSLSEEYKEQGFGLYQIGKW